MKNEQKFVTKIEHAPKILGESDLNFVICIYEERLKNCL